MNKLWGMVLLASILVGAAVFPYVLGKKLYPVATNLQPRKGFSSEDNIFNLEVSRITDLQIDRYHAPGITNEYSRSDPANADGTKLLLQETETGNWQLFDNQPPFRRIRRLRSRLGGENEPRWDPADPDVFYAFRGTSLISYNLSRKRVKILYDFKRDFPQAEIVGTGSEGEPSEDFRWWTILVKDVSGRPIAVVCFDKQTGQIVSKKTIFEYDLSQTEINWVSTCPISGDPIVGWNFRPERDPFGSNHYGAVRYAKDWKKMTDTLADGHADVAAGLHNEELLIYQNNANDFVETVNLLTSRRTKLFKIPFPFQHNSTLNLHFSGNISSTSSRRGWALVVTDEPDEKNFSWTSNQIFLVQLKSHPKIWRLAYNHNNYTGEYFTECFATISRDGQRVYFQSNWGDNRSYHGARGLYTDEYVISLPPNWENDF